MGTVATDRAVGAPGGLRRSVELAIGGMTCASCAARVQKKLNKLDGVTATVNFATETARVSFPAAVSPGELVLTVEQAGYTAALPPPVEPEVAGPGEAPPDGARDEQAALRRRLLLVSLALAVPVMVLAMVPAAQFRNWQWASLALASPVAVWGGMAVPPHRLRQCQAWRRHHGHPDLGRGRRGLPVVPVRAIFSGRRAGPGRTWARSCWRAVPWVLTSTWMSPRG